MEVCNPREGKDLVYQALACKRHLALGPYGALDDRMKDAMCETWLVGMKRHTSPVSDG